MKWIVSLSNAIIYSIALQFFPISLLGIQKEMLAELANLETLLSDIPTFRLEWTFMAEC